jgi:hypothetical protein
MNVKNIDNFNNSSSAGYILIFLGSLIALFLANEIYQLYLNPEENIFLNYISSKLSESDFLLLDGGPIALGTGAAFFFSIFFLILFMWIIVGIGFRFIKYGAYIVTSKPVEEFNLIDAQLKESNSSLNEWTSNKHSQSD